MTEADKRHDDVAEFNRYWKADAATHELRNARAGYMPASNADRRGMRFVQRGQLRRVTDSDSGLPHVEDTREDDGFDVIGGGRGTINPPKVKQQP